MALIGARRRLRRAPSKRKDAVQLEDLDHMLRRIDTTTNAGRRDRAVLLVGIAAALRRSELVRSMSPMSSSSPKSCLRDPRRCLAREPSIGGVSSGCRPRFMGLSHGVPSPCRLTRP